jgi:hypothetical protein
MNAVQQTGNKGLFENSLIGNELAGVGVDNTSHASISSIRALTETHNEHSVQVRDRLIHSHAFD